VLAALDLELQQVQPELEELLELVLDQNQLSNL